MQIEFTVDGRSADLGLLTFESDNESVATVNNQGTVTGVSAGTAHITIAYGEKSVKATINVTMRSRKLVLSREFVGLLIGENVSVAATAYIGSSKDKNAQLVWTSEDPNVATVNNGEITAVGGGNATITVAYGTIVKTLQVFVATSITAENVNSFDEKYINIYGRSYVSSNRLHLDHVASAVELAIIGTSLSVNLYSSAKTYMQVFVDDATTGTRLSISAGTKKYTVAENLMDGYHKIRIVQATEAQSWTLVSFEAAAFATVAEKSDLKIEFIGDSITTGYAVLGAPGAPYSVEISDCTSTYAYFAAQELNANYSTIALNGICTKAYYWQRNINMATMYKRISNVKTEEYAFDFNPDIIVLNLGTNEGSYLSDGGADYGDIFPNDYQEFLTYIRQKNPNAYVICLYGMLGKNSVIDSGIKTAVENMKDEKIVYNPFLFDANASGGAGHPSVSAQKIWGNSLVRYIQTLDV
ncbi:MAG: Ig-like domain-containing protein [Clostridia bacterium]|nr:Ig-like domain-containing protein [Clostridia bacterium]